MLLCMEQRSEQSGVMMFLEADGVFVSGAEGPDQVD
jgi:hypothetical protein